MLRKTHTASVDLTHEGSVQFDFINALSGQIHNLFRIKTANEFYVIYYHLKDNVRIQLK